MKKDDGPQPITLQRIACTLLGWGEGVFETEAELEVEMLDVARRDPWFNQFSDEETSAIVQSFAVKLVAKFIGGLV